MTRSYRTCPEYHCLMVDFETLDRPPTLVRGGASELVHSLAVCWSSSGDHLGEILRVPGSVPHSAGPCAPYQGWAFGRSHSTHEEPGRVSLMRPRLGPERR